MSYVNDVSAIFQSRCPSAPVLSPEDYTLIAEWGKQEIPFEIVSDSINMLCDRLNGDTAEIKSIKYFQSAIRNNFTAWLQTSVDASH
jgi:hypothetical protein